MAHLVKAGADVPVKGGFPDINELHWAIDIPTWGDTVSTPNVGYPTSVSSMNEQVLVSGIVESLASPLREHDFVRIPESVRGDGVGTEPDQEIVATARQCLVYKAGDYSFRDAAVCPGEIVRLIEVNSECPSIAVGTGYQRRCR